MGFILRLGFGAGLVSKTEFYQVLSILGSRS